MGSCGSQLASYDSKPTDFEEKDNSGSSPSQTADFMPSADVQYQNVLQLKKVFCKL